MRISDWSSVVCSSDLLWNASQSAPAGLYRIDPGAAPVVGDWVAIAPPADLAAYMARRNYLPRGVPLLKRVAALPGARVCRSGRSEERRVGKECVSTCRSRWYADL